MATLIDAFLGGYQGVTDLQTAVANQSAQNITNMASQGTYGDGILPGESGGIPKEAMGGMNSLSKMISLIGGTPSGDQAIAGGQSTMGQFQTTPLPQSASTNQVAPTVPTTTTQPSAPGATAAPSVLESAQGQPTTAAQQPTQQKISPDGTATTSPQWAQPQAQQQPNSTQPQQDPSTSAVQTAANNMGVGAGGSAGATAQAKAQQEQNTPTPPPANTPAGLLSSSNNVLTAANRNVEIATKALQMGISQKMSPVVLNNLQARLQAAQAGQMDAQEKQLKVRGLVAGEMGKLGAVFKGQITNDPENFQKYASELVMTAYTSLGVDPTGLRTAKSPKEFMARVEGITRDALTVEQSSNLELDMIKDKRDAIKANDDHTRKQQEIRDADQKAAWEKEDRSTEVLSKKLGIKKTEGEIALQPIEKQLKQAEIGKTIAQTKEAEAKTLQIKDTPAGGSKAAIVRARAENIAGSVKELGRSLSILSNMDIGTDMGIFGGVKPGTTLFSAPLGATARGLTGESAKQYKIASSNLGIALATIDNGGYRPTQALITNFQDKLAWQSTDTIYTKIFSMADAKEQAKARAIITLEGPDLPEEQKATVREEIAKMDQLVPFSPEDVTNMQKKNISINDWMANKQKIEALPPADKSAVEYAEAHPKDPNSKKILELHGVK